MGKASKKNVSKKNTQRVNGTRFAAITLSSGGMATVEGMAPDRLLLAELGQLLLSDDPLGVASFSQNIADSGRDIYDLEFLLRRPGVEPDELGLIPLASMLGAVKVAGEVIRLGLADFKEEAYGVLEQIKAVVNTPDAEPLLRKRCLLIYSATATPRNIEEAKLFEQCAASSPDVESVRIGARLAAEYIAAQLKQQADDTGGKSDHVNEEMTAGACS